MVMLEKAIDLCKKIEELAPSYGFHVALTGGVLYKDGDRKDIDLVLYQITDQCSFKQHLLETLKTTLNFTIIKDYGFVVKTTYNETAVDLLFPGYGGDYDE